VNYRTAAHEAIAKAFNPARALGYIPDADHKRRQKDSRLKFGASPAAPSQASLISSEGPLVNQGESGHCTGAGTSQIVYTSSNAAGAPLPFFPSPKFIYALARILERQDASQALTDSGAMPSDLLTVLRQYGVVPMVGTTPDGRFDDVWSADDIVGLSTAPPPNVNEEPSLLSLETGGLKLLTGEYRVDETSFGVDAQIMSSLAGLAGKPAAAGIGIFVDTAFMNWNPASGPIDNIDLNDPQGGGHWLALTYGYTTASGLIVFGGPNSWGGSWPNGTSGPPHSPYWKPGHYEITATCLQKVMSDCLLFPVTVLP
jgi:hypothetical protein